MKRILDIRTMTYAYEDGSGVITEERRLEKLLLKDRIMVLEGEYSEKNAFLIAALKLAYFTNTF